MGDVYFAREIPDGVELLLAYRATTQHRVEIVPDATSTLDDAVDHRLTQCARQVGVVGSCGHRSR